MCVVVGGGRGGASEPAAGTPAAVRALRVRFFNLHLPSSKNQGVHQGREWSNKLPPARKIRCVQGALAAAGKGIWNWPTVAAGDFNIKRDQSKDFITTVRRTGSASVGAPTWDICFRPPIPEGDFIVTAHARR